MNQNTVTETDTGWQSALDRRLVSRVTRPLVKQGMINNVLSRSILSRHRPLLQSHPILNRTLHRLNYSEAAGIKVVPIIYRVQQDSFDRAEVAEGASRGSFSAGDRTAPPSDRPSEHTVAIKSGGDVSIKERSGGVVQKKGSQSEPDEPSTDNTNKFQADVLKKKLNPRIAGTKISDTVLTRAKRSILNSPLSSKLVQKRITRESVVKPEQNVPVVFNYAPASGTGKNPTSADRPENSGNDTKTNSPLSVAPLTLPGLNLPANRIDRKKEKSIEPATSNDGIPGYNHESQGHGNDLAAKKPGEVTGKQTGVSNENQTKRNGGIVAMAPSRKEQITAQPENETVFTKQKGVSGPEPGKHPENRLPPATEGQHLNPFRHLPHPYNIPTLLFGNDKSNSMPDDSLSAVNKSTAVGSRIVTGITQGNNTLLRHTDRKVIWRKHAGHGQAGGMERYPKSSYIQWDGGNNAIVRRTAVGSARAITSEEESGRLNDQAPPLEGRTGGVDINKIAEKVGRILYKKLVIERERRGIGRWA